MKFTLIALAAVLASANAISKPSLSISVTDGNFDGVGGLDPTLTWSGSSAAGDNVDIEYGVEATAVPTTDIASLPKKIFGTLKTDVAGWGVSIGANKEMASGVTDIEVSADNEDADLSVKVVATADGGVDTVSATKGIDVDGASLTITPTYSLASEDADVVVTYSNDDTSVELTASADSQEVVIKHDLGDTQVQLTASKDAQELVLDHTMDKTSVKLTASVDDQEITISQQIDDDNKISPTISRDGSVSVEWERSLDGDNSLTATVKPDDSIDVEWKDDNWTANINAGLEGTSIGAVSISAKRDVNF